MNIYNYCCMIIFSKTKVDIFAKCFLGFNKMILDSYLCSNPLHIPAL